MRTEIELSQIALDFVTDSTTPQSVFEYAAELEQLGAHGARIPKVRANEWMKIVSALVGGGKLREENGVVLTVVEVANDFEQMRLF